MRATSTTYSIKTTLSRLAPLHFNSNQKLPSSLAILAITPRGANIPGHRAWRCSRNPTLAPRTSIQAGKAGRHLHGLNVVDIGVHQRSKSSSPTMTGMRWWIGAIVSLACVVRMEKLCNSFRQQSHSPPSTNGSSSAICIREGCFTTLSLPSPAAAPALAHS